MKNYFAFSRAHQAALNKNMGHDEALGFALAAEYAARPAMVERDNLLAGLPKSYSLVYLDINGLTCATTVPEALCGTADEVEARAVITEWLPRTTSATFERLIPQVFTPDEQLVFQQSSLGWGGGWGGHAILGYDEMLAIGVDGVAQHITEAMQAAAQRGAEEATLDWYRGLLHVCAGISAYIMNHATHARQLAENAEQAEDAVHFAAIAEVCEHIAHHGARGLRDAVQLFCFMHVLDNTDSPGRIDQFLWPYYQRLPGNAEQQQCAAMPILDAMWQKFIAFRSWNVCLGGQTMDGRDATNALSFLFLDLQAKYDREAPNLSVRFFPGSTPELMKRCVQIIARGAGNPALYNDESVIPALCSLGISLEHARNYALNGCSQVDIQGMSHMGLEDGEINLAKCLEFALHGGKSALTGQQVSLVTLPVEEIHDFSTLYDEYQKHVEYCTRLFVRRSNLFQQVIAETAPHLFRSLFFAPCIESGRDFNRGGALYNHGQFLTEGVANTADALYAIRELVFGEGRLTLPELVTVLDADWQGHEALCATIKERVAKYGNDIAAVDEIVTTIVTHYFSFLRTLNTWRGGIYTGGLSTFSRAPGYGKELAASADGRHCGETVADSCGPACGRDRQGPTAMLHSAAKFPHHLACSGVVLNMKLSPSIFTASGAPSEAIDRVAALFNGYFHLGGQQLQVNVVDSATLRAAQASPADYQYLIVRVAGFCAKFVDLEPALQQDIIGRTVNMV